jgi:hypothetical protein
MKLAPAMQFVLVFDRLWVGLLSRFEVSSTGFFISDFNTDFTLFFVAESDTWKCDWHQHCILRWF